MHIESLDQASELLKNWQLTRSAYQHALGVLELDAATAAPSGSCSGSMACAKPAALPPGPLPPPPLSCW